MMDIGPFGNALEAIDSLPQDQQEELFDIVRKRWVERSRERLAQEARESRAEFDRGDFKVVTVDELMREITP